MSGLMCQKGREVVNRGRDGSMERVRQCANGASKSYKSTVSPIQCEGCTLRQPLIRIGSSCRENQPSDPTWPEPHYSAGGVLVYSYQCGVSAPPTPQGYRRREEEGTYSWWFESEWSGCSYRQMMNKRTPKGDLQVNAHCGLRSDVSVSWEQCERCSSDTASVGGTLDKETALENLSLPESMKELDEHGVPNSPLASQLMATYWTAVKRWIMSGRPTRSAEEVKTIYDDFCGAGCAWYDTPSQRCKGCGCRVAPKGIAILNKIKMATEHCPQRFW